MMAKSAAAWQGSLCNKQGLASRALSVDDGGTVLLVLLLGDPGSREGGEGSQSGGTLPDGELAVGGGDDLDLGAGGGKGSDLSLHAVSKTVVHGGTTGKDDVLKKLASGVQVGLVDGRPGELLNRGARLSIELGLEEELGDLHADSALDLNLALVWKGVGRVELGGALGVGELSLEVLSDEAELLLDFLDDFKLSSGGEGVARLEEELLGVLGDDAASDLHLLDGVGDGEAFEDRDSMGNTITRVDDETGGSSVGVKGHDGLDGDVKIADLESLEHLGGHHFSVGPGVPGSFSDEDTLDLAGNASELVVEGVMPHLLHITPVIDDTVCDGVLQVQNTSLSLGLVADVLGLLGDTLHGASILGAANNGGEDVLGCFLSGETGLHHS
jgi:hypothetical protein